MRAYEVWTGDSVELLKQIPDNSIHAIVTDPPYGLGKVPDIRVVLDHWLDGREYRPTGGGFMGQEWDAFVPGPAVWVECMRVLRPGGFCVAFSGTRTVDLLGLAMRLAGFEVRDLFSWNQFQGFPKSLDISKAIDDAQGAVREVVGRDMRTGHSSIMGGLQGVSGEQGHAITAPATKDAQKWSGYGTGLKPAFEPAIFARKPLDGTYAQNVLKWGAGALNIDRCRYPFGDPSWLGPQENDYLGRPGGGSGKGSGVGAEIYGRRGGRDGSLSPGMEIGRYPSNTYATPKASRAEREAGLTAQNMLCSCKPGGRTWANADRNQNTTSEKAQSREPDTIESRDAGGLLWRTAGTGNNRTGLSPPGMTSTTSTETDSTTDLKTCNSSQNLNTKGSTLDVKSGTAFGGSLAVNAKSLSQSPKSTGTSKERGRSTGGVAHVTSESLSSPSVCGVCGKRKKASTGASATRRKEGTKGLNSPRAGAGRTAEAVLNLHPT